VPRKIWQLCFPAWSHTWLILRFGSKNRVTRLGDLSPIGRLLLWANFWKFMKQAEGLV
jgi:hypothetical protein